MATGISHTFGGMVVVVDMDGDLRIDITPGAARDLAMRVERIAAAARPHDAAIEFCREDGRVLRWTGSQRDAAEMAASLRDHAGRAEARP